MMEVKVENAGVISADRTASPRFVYQQQFHLLLATRHGFAHTSLASPSQSSVFAVGISAELGQAVVPADTHLNWALATRIWRSSGFGHQRNWWRSTSGWHRTHVPMGCGRDNAPGRIRTGIFRLKRPTRYPLRHGGVYMMARSLQGRSWRQRAVLGSIPSAPTSQTSCSRTSSSSTRPPISTIPSPSGRATMREPAPWRISSARPRRAERVIAADPVASSSSSP